MAQRLRRVSNVPKRAPVWFGIELNPVAVASNSAVLLFTLNAGALALRPFTVVRTRMKLLYQSDQSAALEEYGGALGIAVVTDRAAAAGIGSVPNPFANIDSDAFFVHDTFYAQSGAAGDSIASTNWISIDSKAMRKVGIDDDIVGTVEALSLGGLEVGIIGRMLVKMH